jgi:hypothetical protein
MEKEVMMLLEQRGNGEALLEREYDREMERRDNNEDIYATLLEVLEKRDTILERKDKKKRVYSEKSINKYLEKYLQVLTRSESVINKKISVIIMYFILIKVQ